MRAKFEAVKLPAGLVTGLFSIVVAGWILPISPLAFEGQTSTTWQVYFSPDGGCTQAITDAIKAAQLQIMVQAYEMTSPQIKSALLWAHRRGVEVQAIFDPEAFK